MSKSETEAKTRVTKVQVVKTAKDSGNACLVLIYPPGPDMGKRFPLSRNEVALGRGGDCDVQVDRDSVSRRHARVVRSGDHWAVEDLQSTNGTYVNDMPVTRAVLRDGDFVKIGAAIFKFFMGSGVEASYHEEIYKMTIVDALTGAHNKRYFLEFLDREMARCTRSQRPLALLMFDIDHFKVINDKHGHLTGDYVLREMSRRLLGHVRREELLARYGGEEFAAVLPDTDLANARSFGELIRQLVGDQPFGYEGDTFTVTVSVGVACIEGEDIDVMEFIKRVDDNLYRAKREGRNRVVAGTQKWNRWKAVPTFSSQVSDKTAIAALYLLARDQILASASGAAHVDDLEGLLYSYLREHEKPGQTLSFGTLEGSGKLLVALEGRNPVHGLRAVVFEALRRCAEVHLDARFAVGPIQLAKEGARAVEDAVAGLDEEIGILENGHHLPQPVAVALRSLDGVSMARAKAVLELGETLLQWLALCAAAEMGSNGNATQTAATLRRGLAGSITMEHWCDTLAAGIDEILASRSVHDPAWRMCLGDKQIRDEVFAWLDSFVQLRNGFSQVATSRDEHVARQLIDDAAPRLRLLVKRELRAVMALVPAEVELVGFEGELQSYRTTRLIGDRVAAPVSLYSRRRMNPGLWLFDAVADRAIPLEPYFIRDTCPKCGARELFLLNRLDKLEFRNPASGHVLSKPVDDMPFSPEARERLLELIKPQSGDEQTLPSFEEPVLLTRRAPAREVGSAVENQRTLQPASDSSLPPHAPDGTNFYRSMTALQPEGESPLASASREHTASWRITRAPQVGRDSSPANSPRDNHTILYLAANPAGTDSRALDREAHAIQVELERSGFRDCFELVTRWAATPLDLLREMRKLRPTIIHFSGHGRRGASDTEPGQEPARDPRHQSGLHEDIESHGLYFQGADGRPQLVPTSALKETFGATGSSVRLVVLNACYSAVQAEALLSHIDCVVGVSGSIREDAARNFAIGFYGGLGEQESVAAAYKQGCAAISLEGLRDGERPQLKVRPGVDVDKLVLATKP